jgi:hypothetical protein
MELERGREHNVQLRKEQHYNFRKKSADVATMNLKRRLSILSITLLTFFCNVGGVKRWFRDFTVVVASGKLDCFYLPDVATASEIEISFEVTFCHSGS